MTYLIKNLTSADLQLVCGGVTEGPDGKGCTDHEPMPMPGFPTEQGGPLKIDVSSILF